MSDLDALKAAALAATPGPWTWGNPCDDEYLAPSYLMSPNGTPVIGADGEWDTRTVDRDDDAAYIAAASPDVVLDLIAQVRSERALADDLHDRLMLAFDGECGCCGADLFGPYWPKHDDDCADAPILARYDLARLTPTTGAPS